jgi:hypothetical protein
MSNIARCQSIKNKNDPSQCPHNAKNGDIFCGIHSKAKTITLFALSNAYNDGPNPVGSQTFSDTVNNSPSQAIALAAQSPPPLLLQEIFAMAEIMNANECANLGHVVEPLEKKKKKVVIKSTPKKNKSDVCNPIVDRYTRFLPQIVKIQQWVRKIWRNRCIGCANEADFVSFENLVDIPYPQLVFVYVSDSVYYGFHIDSITKYIENSLKDSPTKPIKNPYTSCNLSDNTIISIQEKAAAYAAKNPKSAAAPAAPIDPEQEFRHYTLDIFQKMDMLDNYTDMNWFLDLDIIQLKNLYYTMVDVWTYRCQMPHQIRQNIVKDGFAFPVKYELVKQFPNNAKNKRRVQRIILDEFNRFITEGKTRDDRKLGCMLMLTSLVEISPSAANAMPQYVQ